LFLRANDPARRERPEPLGPVRAVRKGFFPSINVIIPQACVCGNRKITQDHSLRAVIPCSRSLAAPHGAKKRPFYCIDKSGILYYIGG
jgi:hypothetical protein